MQDFNKNLDLSVMDSRKLEQWDRQQKAVFTKAREDYLNEQSRNTFMGYILNNMGLGPVHNMKTAD